MTEHKLTKLDFTTAHAKHTAQVKESKAERTPKFDKQLSK
jgi:hypothetical protein